MIWCHWSWCHFPAEHGMLTISLVKRKSCHHCHSRAKIDQNWLLLIFVPYSLWTFGDSMSTVNLVWTIEGSFGFLQMGKMHKDALWSLRSKVFPNQSMFPYWKPRHCYHQEVCSSQSTLMFLSFECAYAGNHSQMCQPSLETLWRDHGPLAFASLHFIASTDPLWSTIQAANQTKAESTPQPVEKDVRVMSGSYRHDSHAFIALICPHNILGSLQQCCLMLVARLSQLLPILRNVFRGPLMYFVHCNTVPASCILIILQPFPIRGSCQLSSHAGDRTRLGRWDIITHHKASNSIEQKLYYIYKYIYIYIIWDLMVFLYFSKLSDENSLWFCFNIALAHLGRQIIISMPPSRGDPTLHTSYYSNEDTIEYRIDLYI